MKPSRSLGQLATVVLSLTPLAAAWLPWSHADLAEIARRQDGGDSPATTPAPTNPPASTGRGGNQNTFNLNTGARPSTNAPPRPTGSTDEEGDSGNSTTTGPPSRATDEFDPQDPPGGIVMVTPAPTAGYQLYKIGETVSWTWNYTNLLGTPTALDVLAAAVTATKTYTLTQNMTFATPGVFHWDTQKFNDENESGTLVTDEYKLIIYDADSTPSAVPNPGYLGTFQGFQFGVYKKQDYRDMDDGWQCASCINAGVGGGDTRALGFVLTMCAVTVLSFTWFVTGMAI